MNGTTIVGIVPIKAKATDGTSVVRSVAFHYPSGLSKMRDPTNALPSQIRRRRFVHVEVANPMDSDRCYCPRGCYHSVMDNAAGSAWQSTIETVFLDRDGVINEKMPEGRYVTSWGEFHVLPGVVEAIGILNRAGLRVLVVSNQRGVSRGLYSTQDVDFIHGQFQRVLASVGARVDAFYFCPHDKGHCTCRKPLPGMFEQAVAEFPSIVARSSVIIGDSKSDIEFGSRVGMKTVFIEGDAERQKAGADQARMLADWACHSLLEAAKRLVPAA